MGASVFFVVLLGFGVVVSWEGVLVVPFAVLLGFAFAAPVMAFAVTTENNQNFAYLYRFGVIPLVLFAAPSSRSPSCPAGCRRWPSSRRPTTGSSSAEVRRLGRSPGARTGPRRLPDAVGRHRSLPRPARLLPSAGGLAMATSVLRITPSLLAGSRAPAVLARNLRVYRYGWPVIVSGFFEPLFYLLSLGYGLGSVIGDIDGITYAAFVAPAMLASSAMNGAVMDSTFNVFFKLKFNRIYDAVLGTPVRADRRRDRGDRVGAQSRAHLLHRLPGRHGRPRSRDLVVGSPRAARVGAHRVRLRGRRHGRHDLHAELAGLRVDHARRPCRCSCSRRPSSRCRPTRPGCSCWCADAALPGVDLVRSLTTGTVHPSLLLNLVYLARHGVRRAVGGCSPAGHAAPPLTPWVRVPRP